jgi:hypothetical protein
MFARESIELSASRKIFDKGIAQGTQGGSSTGRG